jgi:hypothetical protein
MKVNLSRLELRFQRLMIVRSESWGDAPGLNEDALSALNRKSVGELISAISATILNENGLSALNRKSVGELISAKGAAITNSLGQRPRDLGKAKRPALKARFMEPFL